MQILEQVKQWARISKQGYLQFLCCKTSIFKLVNSSIKVALNLLQKINDLFVVDITRCFESIPLERPNNLMDAIIHVIKLGFKQAKSIHPRAIPIVWIHDNQNGQAAQVAWKINCPIYKL